MDSPTSWTGKADSLPNVKPGTILLAALGLGFTYFVGTVIYNLFFHPLRHFPGPKLNAISKIPFTISQLSGDYPRHLEELTLKYGYFIRVAPNILTILHPDTVPTVHGHRKGGKDENPRDPISLLGIEKTILGVERVEHGRLRAILASGFSNQAMMEQEPMFVEYADKLIEGMKSFIKRETGPLDVTSWYNWATFDVIGDLSFGESFGCLDGQSYHPWVANIFKGPKENLFANELLRYGRRLGRFLANLVIPSDLAGKNAYHKALSREKVAKRLEKGTERPDYVSRMLEGRKGKNDGMSLESIEEHSSVLIIAGSETTATTMSGATYYLTSHPEALARAVAEVREAYSGDDQISLNNRDVQTPYVDAVLNEALRLFPAAPLPFPRVINKDGEIIDGQFIPPGTQAENCLWAIHRHPNLFHRPNEFHPERWLGDERFKNDRLTAVMPFGNGPRVCIGKNLANAEMRLLMCKVLWNFDLALAEDSKDWVDRCKCFVIWEKPPLHVYVKARKD